MSNTLFYLCLLLSLFCGAEACAQQTSTPMNLKEYKWESRPLLLFAPTADYTQYIQQKEMLETQQQEISDRDMVVLEIIGADKVHLNGKLQEGWQAQDLRERFRVPQEEFAVILVGKDGTEKMHKNVPVEPKEIFGLIDGMPMRRQEMRQDKQ